MGVGFKIGGSAVFKSYVAIQANPSAIVTLTHPSVTYTAQADGYGIANFIVKKKGTYTIGTNNTASVNTEGNTPTLDILKSNHTYNGQMVKINIPASLSVANYSSNVLTLYWARPGSDWTGCDLRWKGSAYPSSKTDGTSVSIGAGGNITLTNTLTVNGVNHSGLTQNVAYYYSIFSYIIINNVKYWATSYRSVMGNARYFIGTVVTINSTQTWVVPTGWRTIKVFCVGGGGAGSVGGGGGGGYTKTSSNFNVVPGSSYTATIGAGGVANGGNGGTTSFGSIVSAGGGIGGGTQFANMGGRGGSGGGAQAIYRDPHTYDADGTNGGSNGASANSNTYYTGAAQEHTIVGGAGQGSTTRAWGSSSGTLYSGGGGGGGIHNHTNGGSGGSGGGGAGSSSRGVNGNNGSANTGGGGGGGHYYDSDSASNGGNGGSGVILVQCVA